MFRRLLALIALFLLAAVPANASAYGRIQLDVPTKETYAAASTYTAPAANTTDFWQIYGSDTKTIKILRIEAAYAGAYPNAVSDKFFLIKRSTANSGGTSTVLTNVALDSTNSAATAVVRIYTANPSSLGTTVGRVHSGLLANAFPSASGYPSSLASRSSQMIFDHNLTGQAIVLRGATEGLCLNFNSVIPSATTPLIAVTVFWTEE